MGFETRWTPSVGNPRQRRKRTTPHRGVVSVLRAPPRSQVNVAGSEVSSAGTANVSRIVNGSEVSSVPLSDNR